LPACIKIHFGIQFEISSDKMLQMNREGWRYRRRIYEDDKIRRFFRTLNHLILKRVTRKKREFKFHKILRNHFILSFILFLFYIIARM